MKKKGQKATVCLTLILSLLTISAISPAYGSTFSTAGSTAINYHVDPAYSVMIPMDMDVSFNETTASYGKIVIEEAKIDEGKCIQVSLVSDFLLKNASDSRAVIPYQIYAGGQPFAMMQYTKAGEETPLTVEIDKEDWKKATAGAYSGTVTFDVSYVDKNE